jgi:uncharacterized protein YyaL (SSP411 family)
MPHSYQNRLAEEKSPHLLQHAHNPVDWYPWGEEAFEAARRENKPIFLSIGYATCHWCHVMSRECFENLEIASLLNEVFINVKVDREELPEVDGLYMELAQALMVSGAGWPLNVILTPELKPFYASTYMPPESNQEMMGLKQLATHIEEVWQSEERELLLQQAEQIVDLFSRSIMTKGDTLPTETHAEEALRLLFGEVDPIHGGMKGMPKFPLGFQIPFFLSSAKKSGDPRPLFYAKLTLDKMFRGGIFDHVGGGFSRYSVDEKWMVPRFEKMLSDNAILASAYLDAWKYTKKKRYRYVACKVIDYVFRDLRHPEGGFYSAEDADINNREGAFYLWSRDEIASILPKDDVDLFCQFFGVLEPGNFEGKNILHCPYSIKEFAALKELSSRDVVSRMHHSLRLLFERRILRDRPFKDDKILTSWNGLMIDACFKAGLSFGNVSYTAGACKAAEFIYAHLWQDGRLMRRFREGQIDFEGNLNDYVYLIRALITLFEGEAGIKWLKRALSLTALAEEKFRAEGGAYYLTPADQSVLLRRCELYDGPEPSGNSIHAENLFRLYKITNNQEYLLALEDILKAARGYFEVYPQGAYYHLFNLERYLDKNASTLIIALDRKKSHKERLTSLLYSRFIPFSSVIWKSFEDEELSEVLPYTQEIVPLEGKTTLYICKKGACLTPHNDWEGMEKAILNL